ncbi:recombinase family protein [Streptomyces sp. M19]
MKRPDEYDVIVFWRLDRAVRSMADMSNLAAWAREHDKRLIFAEGPGGGKLELDLTSGSIMAELIMLLLAFAAQMESQATAERVTGSRAALRTLGRWHGGQPRTAIGLRRIRWARVPFWSPTPTRRGAGAHR